MNYLQKINVIILIFMTFNIFSQTKMENLSLYDNYSNNNDLINGRAYLSQILAIKNKHQFYKPNYMNATINYNEQLFNVPLKYDIVNDLVIAKYNNTYAFSVITDFINEFSLDGHVFIKLLKHKDLKEYFKNGFFENIFQGRISLYIKHIKSKVEVLDYSVVRFDFTESKILFIKNKNKYFKISKLKHLKKALPSYKKEISSIFKNQRITSKSLKHFLIQIEQKQRKHDI